MIPNIPIPKGIDADYQFKRINLQNHEGYIYAELGFEAAVVNSTMF